MRTIVVRIGAGELLDRLTIVELKSRHAGSDLQPRLRLEVDDLGRRATDAGLLVENFERELSELRSVNEALWRIEDEIRACEVVQDFGPRFVELARAIYTNNDRRSRIKRAIDERYGSAVTEQKIYSSGKSE